MMVQFPVGDWPNNDPVSSDYPVVVTTAMNSYPPVHRPGCAPGT